MNYSSKLLENAVNAFATLPGIGKKTALRLALHLLRQPTSATDDFAQAVLRLRHDIQFCSQCHNLSDAELCGICANPHRDRAVLCVVESIKDVMAIENTQQYRGLYHILGGVISPLEGIGPADLFIPSLLQRAAAGEVREVIMAISPTIEGETTIFYLSKQLQPFGLTITTLARGIAFGGELEYADEVTLGRSITTRRPYES